MVDEASSYFPSPPASQPDIEYHPNEEKWKARTARRLAEDPALPKSALPDGFPPQLQSPLVWEGKDWKDESEWVYNITTEHLKEIDDAVHHFHSLSKPLGHLSRSSFPLPTLGPILSTLAHALHTGSGFFVLRTIPVSSYSREDNIIIFAGISSHVAPLRGVQDAKTGVLAHITDLTKPHSAKIIGSPAYASNKQVFHTDAADIVALFALETAHEGGVSKISSSWRIYNELAETRPDLIKTLSEDWPLDGFGGDPPYTLRPLLFHHDSKIILRYSRRNLTGNVGLVRSTSIPPITEAQAEALDAIHFLAEKFKLEQNLQKGDIQYINNLSMVHARDEFVDSPENTRHLLRLWLRNEDLGWKIPEKLQPNWNKLYYSVSPEEHQFPVEPEIRPLSIKSYIAVI